MDSQGEERIMERLQSALELLSEKYAITLDTKLSSVGLELDRVNKLLATRPTSSEVSKIMLAVQDMNASLSKTVSDNAKYLQSVVKDEVADEMLNIISNIKSNGDISLRGVDGLVKQIETVSSDLVKLRLNASNDAQLMNGVICQQQVSIDQLSSTLKRIQAEMGLESSFLEIRDRENLIEDRLNTCILKIDESRIEID